MKHYPISNNTEKKKKMETKKTWYAKSKWIKHQTEKYFIIIK